MKGEQRRNPAELTPQQYELIRRSIPVEDVRVADRAFWLEDNPILTIWLDAFESCDRGDIKHLVQLLCSNFPLSEQARLFLADLITRMDAERSRGARGGRKRGPKLSPAYDPPVKVQRLMLAMEEVRVLTRVERLSRNKALEFAAPTYDGAIEPC